MKRDDRNYCFIKITKAPAPKMVVVRGPGHDDNCAYYGPFQGTVPFCNNPPAGITGYYIDASNVGHGFLVVGE